MRGLRLILFAGFWLAVGSVLSWAANNIVIQQANGAFAVIATTESASVHTLNIVCIP